MNGLTAAPMTRLVGILLLLAATAPAPAERPDWRFTTIAGAGDVPLNVVEAGNPAGPAIVFIHGYAQAALSWASQLNDPALARAFHLVAFDLRGHGASGKPWRPADYAAEAWAGDLEAVMQATEVERPLIVAWSFGGIVVMHYIRARGMGGIAGLQLVGSVGRLADFATPPSPSDPAWVADLLSNDQRANIRAARGGIRRLTAGAMPDDWTELAMWISASLPVYARHAIGVGDEDNSDLAAGLHIPVRLTTGEFDGLVTPDTVEAAARALPNASVRVYPGVGHSPFVEASQAFNADLAAFANHVHGRRPASADR